MTLRELKKHATRKLDKQVRIRIPEGGGNHIIKNINAVYYNEEYDCWMINTR